VTCEGMQRRSVLAMVYVESMCKKGLSNLVITLAMSLEVPYSGEENVLCNLGTMLKQLFSDFRMAPSPPYVEQRGHAS